MCTQLGWLGWPGWLRERLRRYGWRRRLAGLKAISKVSNEAYRAISKWQWKWNEKKIERNIIWKRNEPINEAIENEEMAREINEERENHLYQQWSWNEVSNESQKIKQSTAIRSVRNRRRSQKWHMKPAANGVWRRKKTSRESEKKRRRSSDDSGLSFIPLLDASKYTISEGWRSERREACINEMKCVWNISPINVSHFREMTSSEGSLFLNDAFRLFSAEAKSPVATPRLLSMKLMGVSCGKSLCDLRHVLKSLAAMIEKIESSLALFI